MARPLRRDPHAVLAREVNRPLDVLSGLGKGDGGGTLVGCEVPCLAGFVPGLVAWGEDLPGEGVPQGLQQLGHALISFGGEAG